MTRYHVFAIASLALGCAQPTHSAASSSTVDGGEPTDGSAFTCPERSDAFPYEDRFVTVTPSGLAEASMRYVEAGHGEDVFVLVHGIPTSAYLWRNVIPTLAQHGRVVALDLVGYGRSSRPATHPRFEDHAAYLAEFLTALSIDRPILVVHDLGGMAGLVFAARAPARVRAMAILESALPPVVPARLDDSPSRCTAAQPDHPVCLWAFLRSEAGRAAIVEQNFMVESALGMDPFCPPTPEAMAVYRADWADATTRAPLASVPAEIPIDGEPASTVALIESFAAWLETSRVPKLVLYAAPGFLVNEEVAQYAKDHFPETEIHAIGPGVHFLQETAPQAIADAIVDWHRRRVR